MFNSIEVVTTWSKLITRLNLRFNGFSREKTRGRGKKKKKKRKKRKRNGKRNETGQRNSIHRFVLDIVSRYSNGGRKNSSIRYIYIYIYESIYQSYNTRIGNNRHMDRKKDKITGQRKLGERRGTRIRKSIPSVSRVSAFESNVDRQKRTDNKSNVVNQRLWLFFCPATREKKKGSTLFSPFR